MDPECREIYLWMTLPAHVLFHHGCSELPGQLSPKLTVGRAPDHCLTHPLVPPTTDEVGETVRQG